MLWLILASLNYLERWKVLPPSSQLDVGRATVTLTPLIKKGWEYSFWRTSFRKIIWFLPFPHPFEMYRFNVGYLSEPLFEFQTTLFLLIFFNPAELIKPCGFRNLSKESQTSCGGIVARNNSLLCTHLSSETDEHFCLIWFYSLHLKQIEFWFVDGFG